MFSLFRGGVSIAGLACGCAYLQNNKVRAEAVRTEAVRTEATRPEATRPEATGHSETETSWLSWLLNTGPGKDAQSRDSSISGLPHFPKDGAGTVLAWGGVFGRSPVPIPALGNNITRVAVSHTGIGGAVDASGTAFAFQHRSDGVTIVSRMALANPVTHVSIREATGDVVFLDSAGMLHATALRKVSKLEEHGGKQEKCDFALPKEILLSAVGKRRGRERVTDLDCGQQHCIALTSMGSVYSWRSDHQSKQPRSHDLPSEPANASSDTGVESAEEIALPRDMGRPIAAACGDKHVLLVNQEGVVYSAGSDAWIQLGISAEPWLATHVQDRPTFQKAELVATLPTANVAAGSQHSCLLVRDGTLFTCGFNQFGQLGHHNFSSFAPPAPIADCSVRAIHVVAGGNHTCVVNDAGVLLCIGANEAGQLGVGSLQPSAKWRKVRMRKRAIKPIFVHAASRSTAAIVAGDDIGV